MVAMLSSAATARMVNAAGPPRSMTARAAAAKSVSVSDRGRGIVDTAYMVRLDGDSIQRTPTRTSNTDQGDRMTDEAGWSPSKKRFVPARRHRWLRWVIAGVATMLVLVVAGLFAFIHFFGGPTPAPLTLPNLPASAAGVSSSSSNGT